MDTHESDRDRLANQPKVERSYVPTEAAMLEALRVVLGLPRRSHIGQGA